MPSGTHFLVTRRLQRACSGGLLTLICLLTLGSVAEIGAQTMLVSESPDRSGAVPLEGASVVGDIYAFTSPDTGVDRVLFWYDDPTASGPPDRTENNGPYDFKGGSVTVAKKFDTTAEPDGAHSITARIEMLDGSVLLVTASFQIANDVPALQVSPDNVSLVIDEGGSTSTTVSVATTDGSLVTATLTETAPWLMVTPGGTTPFAATLDVDGTGLAPGTYSATVVATATGLDPVDIGVTLIVNAPGQGYSILMSTAANRSSPIPLAGQVTTDLIYVFTGPDTGVSRVLFYFDDPGLAGAPFRIENNPPYDLRGGSASAANPLDTNALSEGSHTVSVAVEKTAGGTDVVHAPFTVANDVGFLQFTPGTLNVALDISVQQSFPVSLAMSDTSAQPFTLTPSVPWLSVDAPTVTTPAAISVTVDTSTLAYGNHVGTIDATAPGITGDTLQVNLEVTPGEPRQIHLSWVQDPSTTMTVVWRTSTTTPPSEVEYRLAGDTTWLVATGGLRDSGTAGTLHEVTLTGLAPATEYEYRVPGEGVSSEIFSTRTAPAPGAADFDFVYVADTGLIGRPDGLATGTQQVIDEIVAIDPLLVLGGGDYAYFNTDPRFATVDEAIDAWFDQVQPIASRAPLMPTYGNHEVFLGEGYASWAKRFPTPIGFDSRRDYSFDVGDVHFVSVFGAEDGGGLRPGTVAWLDADMTAAEAAGQRWIVPFLHVAPFADGMNHPSNLALRNELGPLFEAHAVQVVLTAHDQSYERTFPLLGVPDAITSTSSSLSCYTLFDGVTWLKVSPGGKLSNISGGFSPWMTSPAPPETAARNNSLHHYAHIRVTAAGNLEVDVYGVTGDGSAPSLVDSFRYSLSECQPELSFDERQVSFSLLEDDTDTTTVQVVTSTGTPVPITIESSASWLSVVPDSNTTPAILTLTANSGGLTPGTYVASVTVSSPGVLPTSLLVNLSVNSSSYTLLVSESPDRSSPIPLDGAAIDGNVYIFTDPTDLVTQVRFYYDDPTRSGAPARTENSAPHDFKGGSVAVATAFDTTAEPDGPHSVTAEIDLSDGSTIVVNGDFQIVNSAPGLVVSPTGLALTADLNGAPVGGTVQLGTTGPIANYSVEIPAGAGWLSVDSSNGATPADLAFTADPTGLAPGNYSTTVAITAVGFSTATLDVDLLVIDNSPILSWSTSSVLFTAEENGAAPAAEPVTLIAGLGVANATIDIPGSAPWLSADILGGDTPLPVSFSVDPTGLTSGIYQTTVTATAPGFVGTTLDISFEVTGSFQILVSFDPDRSNAVSLSGQVLAGPLYVFTQPDEPTIDNVTFWIDDILGLGVPEKLENHPPYDLQGGSAGAANPYDTNVLPDGEHTLSAVLALLDGSSVQVDAVFYVVNNGPAVDLIPGGAFFQLEAGQSSTIDIDVVVTDGQTVNYALDPLSDPWLTLTVLDDTTPGSFRIDVDATGLANGTYEAILRATATGYSPETMPVELTVGVPGLSYFAGDDVADTAVSIVGEAWHINGQPTYPGRFWTNPADGQSYQVEGLMMNARLCQGVYDDLDGDIASSMLPWDPEENTLDYIANMPIWGAHGLLAFNLCPHGGGNPGASSASVDNNPYGSDGRACFDDWYAGLDTPYSRYLQRLGSVIRAADDLGMVVELSLFYWGQDQRLADNDAVLAATDGMIGWVLENGWTNVIIEVANEASWRPGGNWAFDHTLLQTNGSVTLMQHVKDISSGPAGAHLPAGRLLVAVSGHGGYVPPDIWVAEADYAIWHGNGQGVSSTYSRLGQIRSKAVFQADPKPIYTNEQHRDVSVIVPHLQRYASWGYHGRNEYQRVFPTTDDNRWTISKDPTWWNKLAEITGSTP